ncbi:MULTISPECIES: hypothetical protein [Streptosporangium]|uniref:Ribosomal protein L7/L12 n=1 Tax=Streptosporangium brasiliense TaxID=47480 RepID=A0ABT9RI36_9ACTN|nr:hypothetical protein [Streptosporangium brasiliense]MDP9868384.1 ribosomal protein L7/L12 [Streptosporangium brasiliense]
MPNLGPVELLVLLVVMAALAALLITTLIRLSTRGRPPTAQTRQQLSAPQLQQQAGELIDAGKPIAAVKLVREQTGLDLKDAKRYVDDLRAGRAPRPPQPRYGAAPPLPPGPGADLATRVRLLSADGRGEQAVLLVRGETGMSESEARRFVESIQA